MDLTGSDRLCQTAVVRQLPLLLLASLTCLLAAAFALRLSRRGRRRRYTSDRREWWAG